MKKTHTLILTLGLCAHTAFGLSFNQNIVAIYGSGNPDTGWTLEQGNGITVAMRGKHRANGTTTNVEGTYSFPTGYQAPANTRALWNWEFSINSGAVNLDSYDYYVGVDLDPSKEVFATILDALSIPDNSYGNDSTLNGQGIEGLAVNLAPLYNITQQSHNITFYPNQNPNLDATYDYELYAVEKGAGPSGTKLVSVGITVVVGNGGPAFLDADNDGVSDRNDQCPDSTPGDTVTADGCTIQQLVDICALGAVTHGDYVSCIADLANQLSAEGIITNKQRQKMITDAAKSDIGQ